MAVPDGEAWSVGGEVGYQMAFGSFRAGPFAGVDHVDAEIDAYTETGAALGNVAYGKVRYKRSTGYAGIEAKLVATPAFVPSVRVGYATEKEKGDRSASVRLASAQHSMATQTVGLAETERDFVTTAVALAGLFGQQIFWQVNGENRFLKGEDELKVNAAIGLRF